jgi:hypothetical protein
MPVVLILARAGVSFLALNFGGALTWPAVRRNTIGG